MVHFRVRARIGKKGKSIYLMARQSLYERKKPLKQAKKHKPKSYFNEFIVKKEQYLGKVILREHPHTTEMGFQEWTEKILELSDSSAREQFPYPALVLMVAQYVAFCVNKRYFSEILPKISQILLSNSEEQSNLSGLYLQAHEGFLGYWTLKQLLDFQPGYDPFDPKEHKRFCSAYLSAGFPPHEEEILVALYMRLIGKADESQLPHR